MKSFKKRLLSGVLTCALVCSSMFVGAFAASNVEEISALLNYGITIKYNGMAQEFTDATGARVYPISFNGTTYLPVRAVSNLVNLPVEWSSEENTVYLGKTGGPIDVTTLPTQTTKYSWIIKDAAELVISGSDANMTFNSGLVFDIWNHGMSTSKDRVMYFPTNGKSTLKFTSWTNANDTTVYVYDQDYNVIDKFEMQAGQFKTKTLDISGYSKIAFGANTDDYKTENEILKVLDITIE